MVQALTTALVSKGSSHLIAMLLTIHGIQPKHERRLRVNAVSSVPFLLSFLYGAKYDTADPRLASSALLGLG